MVNQLIHNNLTSIDNGRVRPAVVDFGHRTPTYTRAQRSPAPPAFAPVGRQSNLSSTAEMFVSQGSLPPAPDTRDRNCCTPAPIGTHTAPHAPAHRNLSRDR